MNAEYQQVQRHYQRVFEKEFSMLGARMKQARRLDAAASLPGFAALMQPGPLPERTQNLLLAHSARQ